MIKARISKKSLHLVYKGKLDSLHSSMLTYWLTLIICFNDLCFLITKCKLKINTGKGQHNCHQDRCWDNLHEIDPHQSKMCRRNKLMASWQFFFQLAPCVLLPSFPTHKQNTAIHQHGRNCSQPCKASTRVLSQMIRACLHSLRTPHGRAPTPCPRDAHVPSHGSSTGISHPSTSALSLAFTLPGQWGGIQIPAPWGIWPSTNRRGEQWCGSFIRANKLQKINCNLIY